MASKARPLILALETATSAGSVCLARGPEVLARLAGSASLSHSTELIENLEELLRSEHLKLSDVDLFAAASGPGSFTGLRIGLATVKSLAVCARRNCVGISTLAALAHGAGASARTVAILPAGRGEVFAQLFEVNENEVRPLDAPAHVRPKALLEKYRSFRELKWVGEEELLRQTLPAVEGKPPAAWSLRTSSNELAVSIAALALREFANGNVISPAELRATYVRPSDAEINEQWQPSTTTGPV